jgi:uncharacterized protein (TIGR02266 family)
MRIKLKYPDVETFIQKYAVNISKGGIFIATKQPKPVGTVVKFEFLLANAAQTSLIRGEGQVQWTREYDPSAPTKAHGMGVKFNRLDPESQAIVDRALAWRAQQGLSKKDSEGISVASVAPPGATPEPMHMPMPSGEVTRGIDAEEPAPKRSGLDPEERAAARAFDREREEEPTHLGPPAQPSAPPPGQEEPTRLAPPRPQPTTATREPARAEAPAREPDLPTQRSLREPDLPTERALQTLEDDRTLRAFDAPRGDAPVVARTVRGDPTVLERPSRTDAGRSLDQHTRPVTVSDDEPVMGVRDRETRPIEVTVAPRETRPIEVTEPSPPIEPAAEVTVAESPTVMAQSIDDSVRIALERHKQKNGRRHGDELDQMIADWHLSADRVEQLIQRKRPRLGAQATAELERLLRKPSKAPAPSRREAARLLEALLAGQPGEDGRAPTRLPAGAESTAQAQAAGGEPDTDERASGRKRRAR